MYTYFITIYTVKRWKFTARIYQLGKNVRSAHLVIDLLCAQCSSLHLFKYALFVNLNDNKDDLSIHLSIYIDMSNGIFNLCIWLSLEWKKNKRLNPTVTHLSGSFH